MMLGSALSVPQVAVPDASKFVIDDSEICSCLALDELGTAVGADRDLYV